MKVAVVGATGLVGTKMIQVLEERNFPVSELIPAASASSAGKEIVFQGKSWKVRTIDEALEANPSIAIFSAGGALSKEIAPLFAERNSFVVDNSSAWRMHPDVPLVVPEVNPEALKHDKKIIANPNCSTIQMVVALKPLDMKYGIKRIVVSTYQSVTGTGKKAVDQLMAERSGSTAIAVYPHRIDLNILPHIDVFLENGYTKEEMKMIWETKKILGRETIAVTATTVRVPVMGGHSESVNVEFEKDFNLEEVKQLLSISPGIVVQDNPIENIYPMPINSHDKDEVFVGRLRRDESQPNTLNMWIVSDNLRKGAATNAVQIAELLVKNNWVN